MRSGPSFGEAKKNVSGPLPPLSVSLPGPPSIEAIVAASAFYLFLVHTFTADEPFVKPALFRDRNFAAGMAFIFIVGVTYLASLALMTPYLQNVMNYPIVTAGLVLGPRGIGTMVAMMIVGRLVGRVDTRLLLVIGLGLVAWSFYDLTGWTPDVSQMKIMGNGVVQGAGLGFLFVPLNTVSLATLPPEQRTDGTGLFNLSRNIGSSVGISVVTSLLTQNTQANHADIVQHVTAVNRVFESPNIAQFWNPATDAGGASKRACYAARVHPGNATARLGGGLRLLAAGVGHHRRSAARRRRRGAVDRVCRGPWPAPL
jgi:MFS transporter, DHA2 family, multidrug resistance protein